MADLYNIYCDESSHLERDAIPVMVLGAIWCEAARSREIAVRIREIKQEYGLLRVEELRTPGAKPFETKWSKVSPAKRRFYLRLVDYFFDDDHLHFRCVLIDKTQLNHTAFQQTHNDWYYKILFTLLEPIIDPEQRYRIYLDIKDTRGEEKRATLEQVLRNARLDTYGKIITGVQQIRSHESELMQMTDLLIGAVSYYNRLVRKDLPRPTLQLNQGKVDVMERIRRRSGKMLDQTTWLRESKFNILRWQGGTL